MDPFRMGFPMGFQWEILQGFVEDTLSSQEFGKRTDEANSRTDLLMKATKGAFC